MVDGTAAALTADGLTHRFGERNALDGVSLEVASGELIAVIGPNGAGKTTLLSALAGVLTPTRGTVRLIGTHPARRAVGWVPQQPALYSKLSVYENLMLFARLERVPDPDATVALMLEEIGLAERAHDQVKSLSGGNQQRVNIAIGLLAQPLVLLLDEPSSSLDPRQRARLWEFIAALAAGGTGVVYSTHDVFEAQHHADRVLALDEGRLVFAGAPADMDWSY
ncbi:MAG TPA: ABC transporter ATP-binding protein [Solirubrobacteraceae bacterium]|jgi:ABC-2 type transport system ATP-binding protein|nr:ABC transporter ATP-binding protein [Solirubrobacteraceae bacterium]